VGELDFWFVDRFLVIRGWVQQSKVINIVELLCEVFKGAICENSVIHNNFRIDYSIEFGQMGLPVRNGRQERAEFTGDTGYLGEDFDFVKDKLPEFSKDESVVGLFD